MTQQRGQNVCRNKCYFLTRLHGLPRHITSDCGPQFAFKFYKELDPKRNINLCLTTAYHPQTDRLRKRAVQTRKQYLRIYGHHRRNYWQAWLLDAEFAYDTKSTTIHVNATYRSSYGFDPRTIQLDNEYEFASLAAEEWLDRMTTVKKQIHEPLKRIYQKRNTIHIEEARQFNIDDWVLVDRRTLQVKAGIKESFTQKWLVPHKVINSIVSHAYRLEVQNRTRWHNIVHTTLLQPLRTEDGPPDMNEDEAEVWDLKEIVHPRTCKGVVQYRVHWAARTEFDDTWETIDNLYNCTDKLKKFRQKFRRKLRDKREG